MPPNLGFLDFDRAIERVLRASKEYDAPQSVAYSEVFKTGSHPRDVLARDVRERAQSGSYGSPPTVFRIPKGSTTTRVITLPGLFDQVIYTASADWLDDRARNLYSSDVWSFGSRRSERGVKTFIQFQQKTVKEARKHAWVGTTDLADYFETIPQEKLLNRIAVEFSPAPSDCTHLHRVVGALDHQLGQWMSGGRGIPQGPEPSFFFADVYLLDSDRRLRADNIKLLRWIDDRYFFANSRADLIRALRLSESLDRAAHLVRSSPKTKAYTAEEFQEMRAIDQGVIDGYWLLQKQSAEMAFEYAVTTLEERLEASSRATNFLLARVAEYLSDHKVKESLAKRLSNQFTSCAERSPGQLRRWWPVMYYLAAFPLMQLRAVELLRSDVLDDDSLRAWTYEAFLHQNASPETLDELAEVVNTHATDENRCSSVRGKALLVAAKYSLSGWQDLVPPEQVECSDLRQYQAMACQLMDKKPRERWIKKLCNHSACKTESAFLQHFQYRPNPIWATPLKSRPRPAVYFD